MILILKICAQRTKYSPERTKTVSR